MKSQTNSPTLSVIIPAYNEENNLIKGCLDEVENFLKKQKYDYEVLIVDDGSKDKTVELIEKKVRENSKLRLIKNQHSGKAMTVMTGLLQARGEIALFTDMDQATPIEEVDKLLPQFNQGYDIVIGSRSGRQGAPLVRKLMGWGFTQLRIIILGLPFKDTQCGFKAFKREVIESIFPKMKLNWQRIKTKGAAVNAGFDVETLYLAKKAGFTIKELPVKWHYVGTERVQAISDSIEALKDIIRIKLSD